MHEQLLTTDHALLLAGQRHADAVGHRSARQILSSRRAARRDAFLSGLRRIVLPRTSTPEPVCCT